MARKAQSAIPSDGRITVEVWKVKPSEQSSGVNVYANAASAEGEVSTSIVISDVPSQYASMFEVDGIYDIAISRVSADSAEQE